MAVGCRRNPHQIARWALRFSLDAPARGSNVAGRAPIGQDGRPTVDSVAAYDVTLDDGGGFLVCGLTGNEIIRIEATADAPAPWGENIRPRAGLIGWHVIKIGKKR